MYEQPASKKKAFLAKRQIDVDGRAGHDVFVVEVCGNADYAPRLRAEVDELQNRISPVHVVVDSVSVREHSLGQALADDDNHLAALSVVVVKVASGQYRHSQSRKEAGRNPSKLGAWILFSGSANVAVGRELEPGPVVACVSPPQSCRVP